MFEKTDVLVEQKNGSLLGQINELAGSLPSESQSFYQDILNKSEQADSSAFHNEIISVINYELVFLSLQKKNNEEITTEDLKALLPWIRAANKDAWEAMINSSTAQSIYPLLQDVLDSRKELLTLSVEQQRDKDLEALIPSCDLDELQKVLQKHGPLKQFPVSILSLQCELTKVESNKLLTYGFKLRALSIDGIINILGIAKIIELFYKNIKEDSFYKELSTQMDDNEFKNTLFQAMCLDYALSALSEKLEVTHDKLTKIIEMLPTELRKDFENQNVNKEPKELLSELKARLNQMKTDLPLQVQQLKEQQERMRQEQALKEQQENERREQQRKEQQERMRQAQALKEQQENERRAKEFREKQEYERRKPMFLVLETIKFYDYIKQFKAQAKKFAHVKTENYINAKNAADNLIKGLEDARDCFLESNKPMDIKKQQFQKSCIDAIRDSRAVLEQHRGWKQILADFVSAIVSVCSLGLVNCVTGKGMFGLFPTKTESKKILDDFTVKLNVMSC